MSQLFVRGPLAELHFDDDLRVNPVGALVGLHRAGEWRRRSLERSEARGHVAQRIAAHAAASVADVHESVGVVVAEQQRAKMLARVARLRPAADDELLPPLDLELEPCTRPRAWLVARLHALGDHALPTLFACVLHHPLA